LPKLTAYGLLAGLLCSLGALPAAAPPQKEGDWSPEVKRALGQAGSNRQELVKALRLTAADQRKGMCFLIAHMPEHDLRSLKADVLLENVALTYKARSEFPWGKRIPEAVFLNDVLPYANVDEQRDPWRKQLYELCRPLVKDCKTSAEAAQKINATIFGKLKVRYSTARKKPHQSPKESIAQGVASCTGLSILLSDACRSVAVPARLAGTPLWANKSGNHTWVEVWDNGWHFTGAAEQDPNGLDRGWFVGNASQAKKDVPEHAIYAASFRRTKVLFPLVWAPGQKSVFAENVTDRYAAKKSTPADHVPVLVRVWLAGRKKRLALPVCVLSGDKALQICGAKSRGEEADLNDILTFELPKNHEFVLRVGDPGIVLKAFKTPAGKELLLEVEVPAEKLPKAPLTKEELHKIKEAARAFFEANEKEQAGWKVSTVLDKLLAGHDEEVRQAVWKAYQAAPVHAAAKKDLDANQVRHGKTQSPYKVKSVGKRPKNGWPLFIAMHGGGGVPKAINDSQWAHMQIYYKDQPSVTGYKYLALRAPNDVWNGFYDDYVPPLIVALVRQLQLFGDVNPDKVFLMGYSHGGYGAFFIGPKIPDRFAAVHASAAAPTDGTISAKTLRNTRFTFMIGEHDHAYGRRKRCEAFNDGVQKLKRENKGDFPVEMQFKKGYHHSGLPDREKIKEMYPFTRNPVPRHLTWELTDAVVGHFFWLSVAKPGRGQSIDAAVADNTVTITTHNVGEFCLGLDGRLINLSKPLRVVLDGKSQSVTPKPSLVTLCRSMLERGDPKLAYVCEVRLNAVKK
jgi:pimeloyl-ACP methyl ester carboxylesterase